MLQRQKNQNEQNVQNLHSYNVGETDHRSWGFYEVVDVGMLKGEEFCEKKIGVKPQQALSLQRHHGRR